MLYTDTAHNPHAENKLTPSKPGWYNLLGDRLHNFPISQITAHLIILLPHMRRYVFGDKFSKLPVEQLVHYSDVIMSTMASQITDVWIIYSTVCSFADQRKHQSSASLAFVRGIHRWPVNPPHKEPVTGKIIHMVTSSCLRKIRVVSQ